MPAGWWPTVRPGAWPGVIRRRAWLCAGARYRVRFGRGVGAAVLEDTAFDRPRNWPVVSTSRRLEVHFRCQATEYPDGCQLAVQTEVFPLGALRVLTPFLRRLMRHCGEEDLAAIKAITGH